MNKTTYFILFFIGLLFSACDDSTSEQSSTSTDTSAVKKLPPSVFKVTNITFDAPDGLTISGKLYKKEGNQHWILYCHQATYNKAEYHEIASKLLEQGYNGLAIDQRSGGVIPDYIIPNKNETFLKAKAQKLPTSYLDAEQDIIAGIGYLSKNYNQKVLLWGSSYSASLALKIGTTSEKVKAILAFSPGEYFRQQGMYLKPTIAALNKPTFVTSSSLESNSLKVLVSDLPQGLVTQFMPTITGKHGSKALWESHDENQDYWNAVNAFLKSVE